MERSVIISLSILVLGCLQLASVATAAAQNVTYINAHRTYFDAELNNWDMYAADVYCARWDGNKSPEWRCKYPWAAFGTAYPNPQGDCGKCLDVTYTGKTDTANATLRIVGLCEDCLAIDRLTFDMLDVDNKTYPMGYLNVSYTFVDCGDPSGRLYNGQ